MKFLKNYYSNIVNQRVLVPIAIGTSPRGGAFLERLSAMMVFFLFKKIYEFMHFVYIIYSLEKDTFYIDETSDMELRLQWHNSGIFENSYTKITNDWILFHLIECANIFQARKIERHIKNMKSKTYISNLKKHLEISQKLLLKYS